MASGVQVDDECVRMFNELKLKHKLKYIIYKIDDKITVEKMAWRDEDSKGNHGRGSPEESEAAWLDLQEELKTHNECRYIVFDMHLRSNDQARDHVVFASWNPGDARIKNKMLYASSQEALKSKLVGFGCYIQLNDDDDLQFNNVKEKVLDKKTGK